MKNKNDKTKLPVNQGKKDDSTSLPGYPLYPDNDDIFSKFKEEEDIDPEEISKVKAPNENNMDGKNNEKDFTEDESGSDLDVPGSELDDSQENVGNEDEENNYYSLGGDDHNDLDEDKGD